MTDSPPQTPIDHQVLMHAVAEMMSQVHAMLKKPQTVKPQQLHRLVARLHLVCSALPSLPQHQATRLRDGLVELSHAMKDLEDVLPKK